MATEPPSDDPNIPSWLTSAGRLFGLNPIQTRWKLMRLHRKWRALARELAPASRRFENQICPECGAVQADEAKKCSSCGQVLSSPAARFMKSLGLSFPGFLTASSLFGLAMIFIYFRMMILWKGQGLRGWDPEPLLAHGALYPPLLSTEPWRLGTANFVHIGVLHIFFNLTALTQVGPLVEEVFGRARTVFFFMATGLLAMAASAVVMPHVPTAGASGALMGLIGVVAAWGHRRRSEIGRNARNQMLKWAAYTMLFGFMIGANNVAHAAGFIAGATLGTIHNPITVEHTKRTTLPTILGVVGAVAAIACVALALWPPTSSREIAHALTQRSPD